MYLIKGKSGRNTPSMQPFLFKGKKQEIHSVTVADSLQASAPIQFNSLTLGS